MEKYILALDQGTTSSRAIVFNKKGEISCFSWKLEEGIELWSKSGLKFNNTNMTIKEWS
jgi:glycerol kinase